MLLSYFEEIFSINKKNSYFIIAHNYKTLSLQVERYSIDLFLSVEVIKENYILG